MRQLSKAARVLVSMLRHQSKLLLELNCDLLQTLPRTPNPMDAGCRTFSQFLMTLFASFRLILDFDFT